VTAVRELSDAECLDRLAAAPVGRVAFVTPRGLQIIPVNYRLAGSVLMLSTTPGGSLAQLGDMGGPVTFEVDYHGEDFAVAWSVLMQGSLRNLDRAGRQRLAELQPPLRPWPGEAATSHLEFVPRHFSGRVLEHRWT
jgi:nitroimidazol reductase NimA-like FMN-containing flavoprotein (pyridoxamine 5'-phosphate oxidase superfamily)